MPILHAIIEAKKKQLETMPDGEVVHSFLRKDFIKAITNQKGPSIIAEVKPKSPSQGFLLKREDVPDIVAAYGQFASAISVLCDTEFFGGGYDLLQEIRSLTDKPILAKEFVIDKKQIQLAAAKGADAVLLIATILELEQLKEFALLAADLGLAVLLEIHTEDDAIKAIRTYNELPTSVQNGILIGINNRDLDTLEIDLAVTENLSRKIRKALPAIRGIISESGISTPQDIQRLYPYVEGFLVGTSLLRSQKPLEFLSTLSSASKPKVKFCGMTRKEDIEAAEELSADFIGLIFVSSSPRSVTLDEAKILRPSIHRAKAVGVFADASLSEIENHVSTLHLDYVQLHGEPNRDLCAKISVPVIQAFKGVPTIETLQEFLDVCAYVLIDKKEGENQADFDAIASLPAHIRRRLFLAGGLHPDNVRLAIDSIQPFAVDCARGIEYAPGQKDPALMSAFIHHLSL